MKTLIKGLACVTALAALPATASAFTLTGSDYTGDESLTNGLVGSTDPDANEASFKFAWDDAPYTGYINFTADKMFDLYFENYIPNFAEEDQVTGFFLRGPQGVTQPQAAYSETACTDAAFGISGECSFITGEDGEANVLMPDPDEAILAGLEPGDYTIGVYESGNPNEGSADFRAAAVVPVPAGGLLLIGALGGAAALRSRKKKAA